MTDLFADAEAIASAALRHLETLPFGAALSPQDREDLAHEAYAKMLERNASGEAIEHPIAYAQQAVSHLAHNHVSRGPKRFEGPIDPTDEGFGASAAALGPEAALFAHVDMARVVAAVETMPRDLQIVYRLHVAEPLTTTKQIAARLGIGYSTARKRLTAAVEHLRSALTPDDASPSLVASYKLLNAYYAGIATVRQRRAAELLLDNDPAMRVHYRGLVRAHRAAGAMIPPFVARGADPGLFDRIAGIATSARDAVTSALSRSSAEASQVAGNVAGSGVGRGAGGAGATLVAKLAGLGAGGQAAVACLAGGGAVVVCVATGILPAPNLFGHDEAARVPTGRQAAVHREPAPPVNAIAPASTLPSQVGHEVAATESTVAKKKSRGGGENSDSTPASEPIVDASAPPAQQEFGVASAATPVGGAPADTNDSNGAAASTVRGEFGP